MDVKEGASIPFYDLASQLFHSGDQKLIPFLGAGVPLSGSQTQPHSDPPVEFPERAKIDKALDILGLEGRPRLLAAFALTTAYLMSASPGQSHGDTAGRLTGRPDPPSSAELTALFSDLAGYSSLTEPAAALRRRIPEELVHAQHPEFLQLLETLLQATGVPDGESLASVAEYYEVQARRDRLLQVLTDVFAEKKTPTPTHDLLADAAVCYLRHAVDDYLIVTTNYDCLMEIALDRAHAPWVVLSLNKNNDGRIHARFSENLGDLERRNQPCFAKDFVLSRIQPLVLVYKIHGCVAPERRDKLDSVVISDADYVDYISRMSKNEGVVPVSVSHLMRDKPFLFLGYSLKDWNVRSVFEGMVRKRGSPAGLRDYLVTRKCGPLDEAYYSKHNILVLKSDLNAFVDGIRAHVPEPQPMAHGQGAN